MARTATFGPMLVYLGKHTFMSEFWGDEARCGQRGTPSATTERLAGVNDTLLS